MANRKIRAAIIGGAGYTGGEMCRLLTFHPSVSLAYVHSVSNAGNMICDVHTDLTGDTDMRFTDTLSSDVDVMFLCLGHGDSRKFLESNPIDEHVRIIDLSQDFRLAADSSLGPRRFVYGLPEMNRSKIAAAHDIANPGCFATAIQLALLPLAAAGALTDEVHVSAVTGSTGAGQKPTATTHFSWRHANFSSYKTFTHQHLHEIGESLAGLQPSFDKAINFIPYRGDFARGILASAYTRFGGSQEEAAALYRDYYEDAAFTFVSGRPVNLKQAVGTNKCLLSVEKHDDKLLITSVIDNLLKGASGQAVQNMNIMFGLPEREGLGLKPSAF